MCKFPRWGMTVLTMTAVAAVVLLVTGWGSAMAAQVTSVFVTNTSSNPVPVNGTVTVSGTPSVNVGNLHTDTNGNLKVAEQGTPTVHVNNTDANGNLKVAEQGTPTVSVQNFPSSQTVNGSVSVSNFPDAPKTSQIAIASPVLSPGQDDDPFNGYQDVSAYRQVTFYFKFEDTNAPPPSPPPSPGLHCTVSTETMFPGPPGQPPNPGPPITIDEFDTGTATDLVKTYDPAPPNIKISCHNPTSDPIATITMLTGRTG